MGKNNGKTDRPETFGVTFTPESFDRFKSQYKKHIADESFVFEGKDWLTEYATYLIAYMEGVFLAGKPEYKA